MKQDFYSFVANEESADLYLFGEVGGWGTSAEELVCQLKECSNSEINVHINSYGGNVSDGLAIYNILRNCRKTITTIDEGFACSAASVIFCAGEKRIMRKASLLMIHNAWTYVEGNSEDLKKNAEALDKITSASVSAYLAVSSLSEDEIRRLMDAEAWITSDEALTYGFATEIEEDSEGGSAKQSAFSCIRSLILQKRGDDDDEDDKKKSEEEHSGVLEEISKKLDKVLEILEPREPEEQKEESAQLTTMQQLQNLFK